MADGGLFGTPLFTDPKARALARVGVIDIGSNSVRMVVFDGAARSPAYFYNEKILCGLGAGFAQTGRLSAEGRPRALAALKRFAALAKGMKVTSLVTVATAAMREAEDGPEFKAMAERETGLTIHVVDGQEEARFSAQGVLLGWPGAQGMICDIGGSSMELAELLGEGAVGKRETSQLGPFRLQGITGGKKAIRMHIRAVIDDLREKFPDRQGRLFLVGGSWRAIARIDMERRNYPLMVLHEYRMSVSDIHKTAKYIEEHALEELRQICGLSSARMALVPIATEVLKRLIRTFKPKDIAVSSYGIREGLLYEQMPQRLRDRDPLIEASRFAEIKDARLPGFGKRLYRFVLPLFRHASKADKRLIKAACLMHDVSWRAHPDYRAELCFDNVTRANLGGLKHSERVFLGLALQHRYRNKRGEAHFEPLYDLLDEKRQKQAEILGKAMRFGAMMWMQKDIDLGRLTFHPKRKELHLRLAISAEPLFGEVAQARLQSLANALEAGLSVEFV